MRRKEILNATKRRVVTNHAARHKGTKDELVETLNRNAKRFFPSLEKAINNWCSYKTIERFLKSNSDFIQYS